MEIEKLASWRVKRGLRGGVISHEPEKGLEIEVRRARSGELRGNLLSNDFDGLYK